ncbi:uncharacterized protein LOC114127399 [Aphis gossypii]|uniref:uncharacterized protein LOC114127399 n=1 Tax=Aphis gossypii TaxID=80765 RepID=UPI00215946CA|nr:uncharacterized protein LOC114127399 [Aphis gossypii]
MDTKKFKGGTTCAVATCTNYSSKLRNAGNTSVSFYRCLISAEPCYTVLRFPKDLSLQKEWSLKCKRNDKWNPSKSSICLIHFNNDDFLRDLKSELLGYTPIIKKLKPGTIPTLNMPDNKTQISVSSINRRTKMELKSAKEVKYDA